MEEEKTEVIEEQVEDQPTNENESNDGFTLVEKEDGTYGLEDSKDSDSDPDGQTEGEQTEDSQAEGEASLDDIDPEYKGKSIHDIIDMHKNATKLFSKKANELAKYEKSAKIENMSRGELKEKVSIDEMRKKFIDLKVENSSLDPDLDEEAYRSNIRLLAELELDIDDKIRQEKYLSNERSEKNRETISNMKEKYKTSGIEISDEEFGEVSQIASEYYSEDGFVSEKAFEHALVDKYGFENLQKFYQVKAKQSVRKEIEDAQGKVSNTIGGKPGKRSRVVNTRDVTSNREAEKIVASLSDKELDKILNRK